MRKGIFAISLLFSFMVMLGHSFIPHHHHDTLSNELSENQSSKEHSLIDHDNYPHAGISDNYHKSDLKRQVHEVYDHGHTHNSTDQHTHTHHPDNDRKKDIKEEHHSHSFPIHFHFSESGDFEFTRIVNGTTYNAPLNKVDFYSLSNQNRNLKVQPGIKIKYLHFHRVLKNPILRSNSNCLRAPPALA